MGYIVKLGDSAVPKVWAGEPMLLMTLRAEMSHNNHSWMIWANEDGANEGLKILHRRIVPKSCVSIINLGTH